MHTNSLKKYYFIKRFIKHNIDKQSRNTIIIYRNFNKEIDVSEVRELNSYCKEKRLKFMISNNIKLSIKFLRSYTKVLKAILFKSQNILVHIFSAISSTSSVL